MSGTAISQLPAALSVINSDLLPVVEIGTPNVTKRLTVAQLLANTISTAGGVFTGQVEFDQGILLDNNQWLQWRDNLNAPQNVITLDGSNNVVMRTYGTAFVLENSAGTGVASVTNTGSFSFAASGYVGGSGIQYSYTGHFFGFGWNGYINCFVDGVYEGDIATTSWVNGNNFATQSWVTGNYYSAATSDARYLYKGGDTCTGNLTVNGTLNAGAGHVGGSFAADGPSTFNAGLTVGGGYLTSSATRAGGQGINYYAIDTHNFAFWLGSPNVYCRIDGATDVSIGTVSDARFKTDIVPSMFDGLAAIRSVPLFGFRWKDAEGEPGEATPIGFVAQELAQVFPEAVTDTGNTLVINTNTVLAALVGAVKQLAARVEELEAQTP